MEWGGKQMCGRYWLADDADKIAGRYQVVLKEDISYPGPEIYPTYKVPVVIREESNELALWQWGFPNPFKSGVIINARAETIDRKKMFKYSFFQKRCLIPANGFFEWKKEEHGKTKYRIYTGEQSLFAMAGIYGIFKDEQNKQEYAGFVIITREAIPELQNIHSRMPVILSRAQEDLWLDPHLKDGRALKEILISHHEKTNAFVVTAEK